MKGLALQHLPGEFSHLPDRRRADPPLPSAAAASRTMVFAGATSPLKAVELSDPAGLGRQEEVDMEPGSQHILRSAGRRFHLILKKKRNAAYTTYTLSRFNDVQHLIQDGSLKLI